MTKSEIRIKIDDLLFLFWESYLKPNIDYVEWYYKRNGISDQLNKILEIEKYG